MPPVPVVVPENPGPYKKGDAFTIGKQPPPQPKDKNKKEPKVEKKSAPVKKDEIPPRVFLWEEVQGLKVTAEQQLKMVENKLSFEVQPLSSLERG